MSNQKLDLVPKQCPKQRVLGVRLDDEHLAALDELAKRERMSRQDLMRHLLRLTHAAAFGKASPFLSVESLINRKVG